jgi:ribosomal protein S18 acetylase RimI-like enzyme
MLRPDDKDVLAIDAALSRDPVNGGAPRWCQEDIDEIRTNANAIVKLALISDKTAGYVAYILQEDHIEIVRLGVDPSYARLGVGRVLVENATTRRNCSKRTHTRILLPETAGGLLTFFSKLGFKATTVARNHFLDQDGIWMTRRRSFDLV